MATSTFNTAQIFKGAFHVKNSKLSFNGVGADHLVQSVQYQFQQQVSMIYELGSPNVYFNGGRASGTASLSRILGPAVATADALLNNYRDICKPGTIAITQANTLCNNTQSTSQSVGESGSTNAANANGTNTLKLEHAVLTSIGGQQDAQSAIFTEQMQFMFLDLLRGDGPVNPATAVPGA